MTAIGAKPPIGLLVATGALGSLSVHLVVPSLPSIQSYFIADYGTTQLIVSFFLIAFGTAQPVVGTLADTVGRRRVLLFGLTAFVASSLSCALAPTIAILIASRVVQGASGCVGIVVARAMIQDHYKGREAARMLGYLATGVAVSPMIAPVAGGIIQELQGWSAIFWTILALGAALFFLSFFFVGETRKLTSFENPLPVLFRDTCVLARHRDFLLHTGTVCINTGTFFSFIAAAPYISTRILGLSPVVYGSWFGLVALGYACGNFISASVVGRISPARLILFGSIFAAVATLLPMLLFAIGNASAVTLFAPMALFTFGSGFIMPNSLAGVLSVDPNRAGSTSGLVGFLQFVFAAFFSSIMGFVVEASAGPAVVLGLIALVATLGIVIAGPIAMHPRAS